MIMAYGNLLETGILFCEILIEKGWLIYEVHTFWFECTDNGGGHQAFEVKAENKQEAIKKGMAFAKKHASGDICGNWECKMISEWTT